ncbi:DUF465 domain-containing protein [Gammaproteobacteria bacterium AH-315-C21]|nr:DUF465 domain-containing protein [Gammaproteobacteria bacterium]MBN4078984.1 DUF465 domain-containing protein [Gammaproteobacteria bacterium AH-315-C21]PCH63706.1 MAG: hypothetical protein COC09_05140 [Gammaproteobacteria bacterium]
MKEINEQEQQLQLRADLQELQIEHRDLDQAIAALVVDPAVDQVRLRRLKKRKLILKDMIASMESELIPDLNA